MLADYHDKMRRQLADILGKLYPSEWSVRKGAKPPALPEAERLWKLAILLARELGSDIDKPSTIQTMDGTVHVLPGAEPEF